MSDKPLDLDELERLSKKLTETSAKFSESAGNKLFSERDQRIYRDRYNDAHYALEGPLMSAAPELIRLARIGQKIDALDDETRQIIEFYYA